MYLPQNEGFTQVTGYRVKPPDLCKHQLYAKVVFKLIFQTHTLIYAINTLYKFRDYWIIVKKDMS